LGMALGAMQVFGVVLSLEHLNDVDARVPLLQGNSEALVGFSLFAGILIALFTARAISKLCIVNGFSVLILLRELRLSNVHADAGAAASASVSHTPHPWAMLLGFVLPVLATVACFPARASGRSDPEALAPFELPAPASSMHPSAFVVSVLGLPAALAMFSADAARPLLSWLARFGGNPWLRAVLTLAFGMLLLCAFSRPGRVRALFSRAVGEGAATKLAQQAFREAIAPTLLYLLTLALSDLLLETELDISRLTPLIAAAVAITLDFMVILRVHRSGNWACAWRDPRPYVFPVVQRVLRRSEIAAREVSLAQATLFRIFGPFALTEVWVPAPLVARATELIEAALAPGSEAQLEAEASDLAEHPERTQQRRKRLAVLTALAALACLATVVARH